MRDVVDYRIVDYEHIVSDGHKVWRNTDPTDQITTDGSRYGGGDPDPTEQDIEDSEWVNVGFLDSDGEWHYYWIRGPFDEEFWIEDAIEQIIAEYGIVLGESA